MAEALRTMHPVIAVAIIVVVVVAPSMALAAWTMRRWDPDDRSNDNMLTSGARAIGVFFAIIVGFLLVTTFGSASSARDAAKKERASLDAFVVESRDLGVLSSASVDELERLVVLYLEIVRTEELELQGDEGFSSRRADIAVDSMFRLLSREVEKAEPNERSEFDLLLHNLDLFEEQRLQRLLTADVGIPTVLWVVVMTGAALLMGTLAIYPPGSSRALKLFQTASAALVVAFAILALVELEDPYDGAVRVTESTFEPSELEEVTSHLD